MWMFHHSPYDAVSTSSLVPAANSSSVFAHIMIIHLLGLPSRSMIMMELLLVLPSRSQSLLSLVLQRLLLSYSSRQDVLCVCSLVIG